MSHPQYCSFDSAPLESACIWAKTLMNQPFGNFPASVPNQTDTLAAMQYLLSDEDDYTNPFVRDDTKSFVGNEKEGDIQHNMDVVVPAESVRRTDVVMGRGRALWMRTHPGNLFFQKLVAEAFCEYNSCTKSHKIKLSKTIVATVVGQGGRFLKPQKVVGGNVIYWKRLDAIQADRKVAYTFRGIRKQQKRKQTTRIPCLPISKNESMNKCTIFSM